MNKKYSSVRNHARLTGTHSKVKFRSSPLFSLLPETINKKIYYDNVPFKRVGDVCIKPASVKLPDCLKGVS